MCGFCVGFFLEGEEREKVVDYAPILIVCVVVLSDLLNEPKIPCHIQQLILHYPPVHSALKLRKKAQFGEVSLIGSKFFEKISNRRVAWKDRQRQGEEKFQSQD